MFMVNAGAYYLSMLPSLGWRKQEEVFNEQKQIYEYVPVSYTHLDVYKRQVHGIIITVKTPQYII